MNRHVSLRSHHAHRRTGGTATVVLFNILIISPNKLTSHSQRSLEGSKCGPAKSLNTHRRRHHLDSRERCL
jgi:hypothetical protein